MKRNAIRMLTLLMILGLVLVGCGGGESTPGPISPLVPPHNIVATAMEGAIGLGWDYTDNQYLTGFKIFRRTEADTDFSLIKLVGEITTWEDDTVLSSIKYYYKMSAIGNIEGNATESKQSDPFPEFGVVPLSPPPRPPSPTNLAAAPGDGQVDLTWDLNDPETKVYGFKIYRSVGGADSFQLYHTNGNATLRAWTDTEVTNGTLYYYRMTSFGSTGVESFNTSEVFATPQDANPPEGPDTRMMFIATNRIQLFWYPSDPDEISAYNLYRQVWPYDGEQGEAPLILVGANIDINKTDWLDETVIGDNYYAYYLASLDHADPPNESTRVAFIDPDGQAFAWPNAERPPLPPYNLSWSDTKDNKIDVSVNWTYSPSSAEVSKYRVYRAQSEAGPWDTPLIEVSNLTNFHYEEGLTKYQSYWYAVSSFSNLKGESHVSLPVRAEPGPPGIPFLGNLTFDGDYVIVDWSSSGNDEIDLAGFKVYRGFLPGDMIEVFDTADGEQRTWLDSSWFAGQTHYYAVASYDEIGNESEFSDVKNIKPGS